MDEARAWQARPLDPVYPIVFLDALRVKIKENGRILNKAVHLVLGITMEGTKELLGIWIAKEEGAKFWLRVLNDLKNRGVQDIFIACMDGLKGFPEAVENVFPKSDVQLCVVHQVRNSLNFVSWKERKEVAGDLKTIYGASTIEEAEMNLGCFCTKVHKGPQKQHGRNNPKTVTIQPPPRRGGAKRPLFCF